MSGYKSAYTFEEDEMIVRYIVQNKMMHRLKGKKLWTEMAAEGQFKPRSSESLKERFRKHILPKLSEPRFRLKPRIVEKFVVYYQLGYYKTIDLVKEKNKQPSSRPDKVPGPPAAADTAPNNKDNSTGNKVRQNQTQK